MPELVLILVVALVMVGPQKLPDVLKAFGRALAEFKRATNDIKHTVNHEMEKAFQETSAKEIKDNLTKEFGGVASQFKRFSSPGLTSNEKLEMITETFTRNTPSPVTNLTDLGAQVAVTAITANHASITHTVVPDPVEPTAEIQADVQAPSIPLNNDTQPIPPPPISTNN